MKRYQLFQIYSAIALIFALVVNVGIVLPWMISQPDTATVVLGVVLGCITIPALAFWAYHLVRWNEKGSAISDTDSTSRNTSK